MRQPVEIWTSSPCCSRLDSSNLESVAAWAKAVRLSLFRGHGMLVEAYCFSSEAIGTFGHDVPREMVLSITR
jgi:hypothetical protein